MYHCYLRTRPADYDGLEFFCVGQDTGFNALINLVRTDDAIPRIWGNDASLKSLPNLVRTYAVHARRDASVLFPVYREALAQALYTALPKLSKSRCPVHWLKKSQDCPILARPKHPLFLNVVRISLSVVVPAKYHTPYSYS